MPKIIYRFFSKNFTPNGQITHFNNKNFDKLYEASISEVDDVKRYSLYQNGQYPNRRSSHSALYYDEVIRFTKKCKRVRGKLTKFIGFEKSC